LNDRSLSDQMQAIENQLAVITGTSAQPSMSATQFSVFEPGDYTNFPQNTYNTYNSAIHSMARSFSICLSISKTMFIARISLPLSPVTRRRRRIATTRTLATAATPLPQLSRFKQPIPRPLLSPRLPPLSQVHPLVHPVPFSWVTGVP
jgi:hypothetical protein